jgi:hypothetical protein
MRRSTRAAAREAQAELEQVPASIQDERGSKERRSVTLRVLVDSRRGEDLAAWLDKHTDKLQNSRIFYIVQAKSDVARKVFKFGFANLTAAARLRSYLHTYGPGDVKIHVLLRTAYNANVSREASFMYRLELRLKRKLRPEIEALGRGDERVAVPLTRLRDLLFLTDADEGEQVARAVDLARLAVDAVTVVEKNRSRRLRALNPRLKALPAGVGRGG